MDYQHVPRRPSPHTVTQEEGTPGPTPTTSYKTFTRPKPHVIAIIVICCLVITATVVAVVFIVLNSEDGSKSDKPDPVPDYYDASVSPLHYFSTTDPGELLWYQSAHKHVDLLRATQPDVSFVQAEVSYRWQGFDKLRYDETQELMVGSPSDTTRNMTFTSWLEVMFNNVTSQAAVVYFRHTAEAEAGIAVMSGYTDSVQQPVWISANVVHGPNGVYAPVDWDILMATVEQYFPHTTLALGWTNEPGPATYTWEQMSAMWTVCQTVSHPVSLVARAELLPSSWQHFRWLLEQDPGKFTLTVWSPEKDTEVDLDALVAIRNDIPKRFLYYSLPREMFEVYRQYSLLAGNPINHYELKQWDGVGVKWENVGDTRSNHTLQQLLHGKAPVMLSMEVVMSSESGEVVVSTTWQQQDHNSTTSTAPGGAPATNTSAGSAELTLREALHMVAQSNKGIRVVFATSEVVQPALVVLQSMYTTLHQPVWLHAAVMQGPDANAPPPINFQDFIKAVNKHFYHATISLDWTTGSHDATSSDDATVPQPYTEGMIRLMSEMASVVHQPVVVSVDATRMVHAWDWIEAELLADTSYWLRVWGAAPAAEGGTSSDDVSVEHLMFVRSQPYRPRVFYDLGDDVMAEFTVKMDQQENGHETVQQQHKRTSRNGIGTKSLFGSLD